MLQGIEFVRKYGFHFSVRRTEELSEAAAQRWLDSGAFSEAPLVAKNDLNPAEQYDIGFITAPVYDARRKVAFVVSMTGIRKAASGIQVERIGARVRQVCDRISSFMTHPVKY